MSAGNDKYARVPGRGNLPRSWWPSLSDDQRAERTANSNTHINAADQRLPHGSRCELLLDDATPQKGAYGAIQTLDAPVPNSPYFRYPPSAMTIERTQSVLVPSNDNNTLNSNTFRSLHHGVGNGAHVHKHADTVNLNIHQPTPQPQPARNDNLAPVNPNVAAPPHNHDGNNYAQQFGYKPPAYSFQGAQRPIGMPDQSSTSKSHQQGRDLEIRVFHSFQQESNSLPNYHDLLGSSSPDVDLASHDFVSDFLGRNPDSSGGEARAQAQDKEAARRILNFEGMEHLADVLAPAHSEVNIVYTPHTAAVQAMDDLLKLDDKHWNSPKPDDSIPRTDTQRRELVRLLLAAMKDPSQAVDHQMRNFKKRWAANAADKYADSVMEATCWKIALLTERLHTEGPTVLDVASDSALATIKESAPLTFEQRMRYIIVLMAQFKTRCENLIKGSSLHTVVGNPKDALLSSRSNANAHSLRQQRLAFASDNMAEETKSRRKSSIANNAYAELDPAVPQEVL